MTDPVLTESLAAFEQMASHGRAMTHAAAVLSGLANADQVARECETRALAAKAKQAEAEATVDRITESHAAASLALDQARVDAAAILDAARAEAAGIRAAADADAAKAKAFVEEAQAAVAKLLDRA